MNRDFEKLETLQQLKDKGAISEYEFNIEKQKIMNANKKNDNINKANIFCIVGFILSLLTAIVYETRFANVYIINWIWGIICIIAFCITSIGLLKMRNEKKNLIFVFGIISLILSGLQFIIILENFIWTIIWKIRVLTMMKK